MRIDPTTSATHARFSEIEVGCWRREMGNTLESRENLRTMEEAGEGGEGPNSSFTEFPKSFELPSGLGSGWRLYSRRCVDYARPEDAEPQKGATMARPLEKTRRDGTRYTRFPEVEAAIDAAIGQDLQTLLHRARIRDSKIENYIASECLVYLIRDFASNDTCLVVQGEHKLSGSNEQRAISIRQPKASAILHLDKDVETSRCGPTTGDGF